MTDRRFDILIADDDAVARKLTRCVLEHDGHRVVEAESGSAALKALDQGAFDLLLMDGRMPGLSGAETARAIRQRPDPSGAIPIIAVTGSSDVGERGRYMEAGINNYLVKPVAAEDLLHTIRCTLSEPK